MDPASGIREGGEVSVSVPSESSSATATRSAGTESGSVRRDELDRLRPRWAMRQECRGKAP
jgi:hypothetical protein